MRFKIQDSKHRLPAYCTAGILMGSVASTWGLAFLLMYGGEGRMGFHPLVFLTPVVLLVLVLISVLAIIFRQTAPLLAAIAGLVSIGVCYRNAARLNQWGWQKNISSYSAANKITVEKLVGPDIEKTGVRSHDFLWNDSTLIPMSGFKWFSLQHGMEETDKPYYGFVFAGVPHVRVRKVRHGWMGLAFVSDLKQVDRLREANPPWVYWPSKSAQWVTWQIDDKVFRHDPNRDGSE